MDDLRTRLQEGWSKALLAASSVEEGAQELVDRLGQVLGPEAARALVSEVAGRLRAQRQELESRVQVAVKAAIDSVRLPTRGDMATLEKRLSELEAKVSRIEAGQGARPPA